MDLSPPSLPVKSLFRADQFIPNFPFRKSNLLLIARRPPNKPSIQLLDRFQDQIVISEFSFAFRKNSISTIKIRLNSNTSINFLEDYN